MRISRILAISSWSSLALILTMLVSLYFLSHEVDRNNVNLHLATGIRTIVFERSILRDEYINRREDRSMIQWKAKTDELRAALVRADTLFRGTEDGYIVAEMHEQTARTISSFDKISNAVQGREGGGLQGKLLEEYNRKVYSQMLISSSILIDDASWMVDACQRYLSFLDAMRNALTFTCLMIMAALLLANRILIGRILMKGIQRLLSGASIIGGGDLGYRLAVDSDDEIAEVAREINRMAGNLNESFASRQELEGEVEIGKRVEKDLRKDSEKNKMLAVELQQREKNSFNMIQSMVGIAGRASASPEVELVLDDLASRVRSVSELYAMLYSSGSFSELRLDEYCARVASPIVALGKNVVLEMSTEPVLVSPKLAAPIGLIVTELSTNAIKYAFPGDRPGKLLLKLERNGDRALLGIEDDGIGLPLGFELSGFAGLGLNLVSALAGQLEGSFSIASSATGTRCLVDFPLGEAS